MMADHPTPSYTTGEEIANSITHGLGAVLSIAGLSVLTSFASLLGDAWHVVSVSIYGASQILLYTASTLYHAIPLARAKAVLRGLDHSAIFLLIAGTYTPFTLVNLRGPWGWSIFGAVWALAGCGLLLQGVLLRKHRWLNITVYVAMGWLAVIGVRPLLAAVAPGGLLLLLGGGLAYTAGTLFYAWRRLPYSHAIWHGFVLLGSTCHFFAILFYVIPLASG
jgi:hemolysin III